MPTYILTAELDADSFRWLDALRREHFPPERNVLSAHMTLFHRLSSEQVARLQSLETPRAPIELCFEAPIFLGFGVAIKIRSDALVGVRLAVQTRMSGEFSRQDSQRWKPHVTIQNKVPADVARQLYAEMQASFTERSGFATGLLIWEYLDGPWKLVERIPFGSP